MNQIKLKSKVRNKKKRNRQHLFEFKLTPDTTYFYREINLKGDIAPLKIIKTEYICPKCFFPH